jgi:hypothetical protein
MFARRFIERYSKERGKASWQDPTKALEGRAMLMLSESRSAQARIDSYASRAKGTA